MPLTIWQRETSEQRGTNLLKVDFSAGGLTPTQIEGYVNTLAARSAGNRGVELAYVAFGWKPGGFDPAIELARTRDPLRWLVEGPNVRYWVPKVSALLVRCYDRNVRPDALVLSHERYMSPYLFSPEEWMAIFDKMKETGRLPASVQDIPTAHFAAGNPNRTEAIATFFSWAVARDEQALGQIVREPYVKLWGQEPLVVNYQGAAYREGTKTLNNEKAFPRKMGVHDGPDLYVWTGDTRMPTGAGPSWAAKQAIARLEACPGPVCPFIYPFGCLDSNGAWARYHDDVTDHTNILLACKRKRVRNIILWEANGAPVEAYLELKELANKVYS